MIIVYIIGRQQSSCIVYLFNYPEHDQEILSWYERTKHVIYENGLWEYILRYKPSPGMLDTIFRWHGDTQAQEAANRPMVRMDADDFGFSFYGLQVSLGSLSLRETRKKWLLQQHSSRKSNKSGERFTDYDVDICKDVVNSHSPNVKENNII